MDAVRHLLCGEGLSHDVCPVDGGVVHVDAYLLAKELLSLVPHDGVAVHGHDGVLGVVDQRVAHGLHIDAVSTYLIVGVHLAVDGVGIDVEGEYLQRVGMHVKGVFLREVFGHSIVGSHGIACGVVVLAVVACQLVLVDGVGEHDVPVGVADACQCVAEHAVAHDGASLVADDGASEEFRLLCLGVVVSVLAVDVT